MVVYQSLIEKLDAFIRKYYANQLLKGTILFFTVGIISYLLLVFGEYLFYFPVFVKLPILIVLLCIGIWALLKYIISPLTKMQNLGKRISHEQAAEIIGKHFSQVDDKLINVLQLYNQKTSTAIDTSLLEASIEQKSNQLVHLPFVQAINKQPIKKYLPFFVIASCLLILGGLLLPSVFKNATQRLLQPTTHFTPPAPFQFIVNDSSTKSVLWQPHDIIVTVKGDKLPDEMQINIDGEWLSMSSLGNFTFKYTIAKVNKAHEFYFRAAGYESSKYKLLVDFLPVIGKIDVHLKYPKHINKPDEVLQVFSDLTVPEGTVIRWQLNTQHTVAIQVILDSTQVLSTNKTEQIYSWEKQVVSDANFMVLIKGNQSYMIDTFQYFIEVIKDQAPTLEVQAMRDTVVGDQFVFSGLATDDHGIQRLSFVYEILNSNGDVVSKQYKPIKVTAPLAAQIAYYIDIRTLQTKRDENVKMYIEVCDNDVINGGKCVRSTPIYWKEKSNDLHVNAENDALNSNAAKMQESVAETKAQQKDMQKDLESLKSKMLESKTMDWQVQQELDKMLSNHQELKDKMEAIQKRLDEQQRQTVQKDLSPRLQDKQEALKQQLEQMIDKELQEQLQRLQELRQQRNPQQAFDQIQKMEQQNKLFQMNMERVEAMIQQLELQLSLELLAEQLDNFVGQQQDILQKTDNGVVGEKAAQMQDELQKKFDEAMDKGVQELREKEAKAKDKEGTSNDLEKAADQVSNDMEESEQQLNKGQQQGASQKQQQAIQKMKKMAQHLKEQAGGMDAEQIDIDIKATRQLLTNLLRFSFDQEKLIERVRNTPTHHPNYVDIAKEQGRLAGNAKMMKDSLFSLSKRVFQIASNVNKETTELELNIRQALSGLQDRQNSIALVKQQAAMTNANNLALILNELLENLMQDAAQMSGSEGDGKKGQGQPKPGQGNQSGKGKGKGQGEGAGDQLKDIITKQQQLGQGMQKGSGKGQGQGSQPNGQQGQSGSDGQGGGNSGGQGNDNGEYGDAKELARMAREQAQLREQLKQLNTLLNSKGIKGVGKQMLELQNLMDKNETDLVNRRLSAALLQRQQEIMSKLLEAENAVREQEQDDKRQGNVGKEVERPMPPELQKFLKEKEVLFDAYKTKAPEWKPFYKKLNEQYLPKVK